MNLLETLAGLSPDRPLEVRPGLNVLFGRTLRLKMAIYREKEDRWYEVPDEVSTVDGEPQ